MASAGTLYLLSNQNVILARCGLRLDRVDLADRTPEDAHLVADEHAVAVVEVGDDVVAVDLSAATATTTTTPPSSVSTNTTAKRDPGDVAVSRPASRGSAGWPGEPRRARAR